MRIKIKSSKFIAGARVIASAPVHKYPEVAVVGRSNVGKSTFLNTLAQQEGLARTSSTPGRTQELNFFEVVALQAQTPAPPLVLVDLPGFGYAKLSHERRIEISKLTVEYLETREQLSAVILLNDIRREVCEDERAVQTLTADRNIHFLLVLTKCDKVSKNELRNLRRDRAAEYGLQPEDTFCSGKEMPLDEVWVRVLTLLAGDIN